MKHFLKLFFAAAIPFAIVMFAISISHNSWQRALALAVIFAFLFGSLVAQIMTFKADKKSDKEVKEQKSK